MARRMGFDFGLEKTDACFKRKFRWLLKIDGISGSGIQSLPPTKAARPNLTLKEMEVQHLTETIYYPSKPDWKPITISVFDLKRNKHPIFEWLKTVYNPKDGTWNPGATDSFKKRATLELYDGCGNTLETWVYENAYPQVIEFGELDMSSSEIMTADITLRFDRAYIDE